RAAKACRHLPCTSRFVPTRWRVEHAKRETIEAKHRELRRQIPAFASRASAGMLAERDCRAEFSRMTFAQGRSMDSIFSARGSAEAVPIWFVTSTNYPDVQRSIGAEASAFAQAAGFEPKAGRYLLLPGKGGAGAALGGVLFGVEDANNAKNDAKNGAK